MKKLAILGMVALVLAVGLALPMATPVTAHVEGAPFTVDLLAGQDIPVGTVSVWNDSGQLHVKYETNDGWVMTETHLEVATTLSGIPQTKKGNPIPGHFREGDYYDPPATNDTFSFSLEDEAWEPCDTLYIAAHAAVLKVDQEETAWGDGTRFTQRGNWATYFTYHVQFPTELTGTGDYTAEWSTTRNHSPPWSIHLATADWTGPSADEARIVITLPSGTTLGDIQSISWWTYLVSGYVPHVDIVLDTDAVPDGVGDAILVAEGAYQNGDSTTGWSAGSWFNTFDGASATYPGWSGLTGNPNVAQVDHTTAVWLSPAPSPPGPPDQLSIAKLSDYQSATGLYGVSGTTPVLALEIEVDNWVAQSEAYVDDIEVTLSSP